jgi:hypothetical protein
MNERECEQQVGKWYSKSGNALAFRRFLEQAWLRSLAALIVGGLAMAGLTIDSLPLKLAASAFGTGLALLHLFLIWAARFMMRRALSVLDRQA